MINEKDGIEFLRKRYCSLLDALIDKKVGLSQRKIAPKIGVTHGYLARLRTDQSATEGQYQTRIKNILDFYGEYVKENDEHLFEPLKRFPLSENETIFFNNDLHIEKLLEKHTGKGEKKLRLLDTWVEISDFFLNWLDRSKLEYVEVLVLHPYGENFAQRAKGISSEEGRVERIRKVYLEVLKDILKRPYYGERLKVRFYDEVPGLNCYFIGSAVYFAPYLMKQSTYNNFYLGTLGEVNLVDKLKRHFDLLWNKSNSIELTPKLMDEFTKKKTDISLLYDEYVMYNLDESPETPYQIANIKVDKKDISSQLIYTDRQSGEPISIQGSIEFLEVDNHIFFSFRKGAFILDILCYYVRATFIQAVYLHTDHQGRPRTAFGILENQDLSAPKKPSRNAADMPDEIRRFLMHRFDQMPQIKDDFLSRGDLNKSIPVNYHLVRKYVGTWVLYYNVRLGRSRNFRDNPAAGEIAKSILKIEEDSLSGIITCKMEAHDGRKFEGELMYNRHLENSDHILGIILHNKPEDSRQKENKPLKKRILNLIFDTSLGFRTQDNLIDERETLRGTYNITYSNRTQGCGFAILKWSGDNIKHTAGVIDPFSEEGRAVPMPLKHLAFKKTGLYLAPYDLEQTNSITPYSGVYNMYNYGIKNAGDVEKWAVILTAIEITDYGLVIFKGLEGIEAFGFAQVHNGNLYIELQSASQMNRIGYFILYVGDGQIIKNGTIITGVYIGITINDRIPIGKRIILEKVNKQYADIQPKKFLTLEDGQVNIPESIRRVLAGNLKNAIGFLKKRTKIFTPEGLFDEIQSTENLGYSFFEAACFKIWDAVNQGGETRLLNAMNDAVKLLNKALSHGFTDFNLFQEKINKIDKSVSKKIAENEAFIKLVHMAEIYSKREL